MNGPATKRSRSGTKWQGKHRAMFASARRHPSSTNWDPVLEKSFPAYTTLTARTRQLLDLAGVEFPHPVPACVSIDQGECSMFANGAPTITPSGMIWLAHRCRLLTGVDKLALQGIYVPHEVGQEWGDSFLSDLAGNAFSTGNVAVFVILSLVVMAAAENATEQSRADAYAFHPGVDESASEDE